MTKGLSLRVQAAAIYSLVFLAAIAWIEVRFRFWSHGINLLLPYSVLIVTVTLSAYFFSGLLKGDPGSPAHAMRLLLTPLAIASSALLSTSTLWLLIGLVVMGKVSLTRLDFVVALPLLFVLTAWVPLLAGLPAATCYLDVKRRRVRHP